MKYILKSVFDNTNDEQWQELGQQLEYNTFEFAVEWMLSVDNRDGEIYDELPICDEIIDESADYVITYHDGMCETVHLYQKQNV